MSDGILEVGFVKEYGYIGGPLLSSHWNQLSVLRRQTQHERGFHGTKSRMCGSSVEAKTCISLLKGLQGGKKIDLFKRNKAILLGPSTSVAKVPSASALQVLRRLGSIFTSVYAEVQKLKKDYWLELQFSLAPNSKLNVSDKGTSRVSHESLGLGVRVWRGSKIKEWLQVAYLVCHRDEGGGESWRSLRCLFSLYMVVFGQPTSVTVVKSSREESNVGKSNIGDSDNTRDGGKIVGEAIRASDGIGNSLSVTSYACTTFIYGSSEKGERASKAKRSLVKSSKKLEEVFPDEGASAVTQYVEELRSHRRQKAEEATDDDIGMWMTELIRKSYRNLLMLRKASDILDIRLDEFRVVKSSQEESNVGKSNIGDSDNTRDGGKIVGEAIRDCDGIGKKASKAKRSLVKSSKKLEEVFPGEVRK
ncbi:hypothetical protein Tco_0656969 [Tanacetum coccineum]|uniref:Uncharacterized protein n=1 Tax=Tanacetum coccineum TaxID=301880 RepID=A0ABQ4XBD6_9ASTR